MNNHFITKAAAAAILGALGLTVAVGQAEAACYVKEPLKPIRKTIIHRDVVEHGVYSLSYSPGLYGWRLSSKHGEVDDSDDDNRILLRPGKHYAHYQPPYIHHYRETIWVQPEGYRWRRVRSSPDCDQ